MTDDEIRHNLLEEMRIKDKSTLTFRCTKPVICALTGILIGIGFYMLLEGLLTSYSIIGLICMYLLINMFVFILSSKLSNREINDLVEKVKINTINNDYREAINFIVSLL